MAFRKNDFVKPSKTMVPPEKILPSHRLKISLQSILESLYTQGGNVGNLTIAMTTPVTTLVTTSQSEFTLEMCFFLGSTRNSWPSPSAPSVYLKQEPERQIITRCN